jgi:flagellar biogenesis protein FliO
MGAIGNVALKQWNSRISLEGLAKVVRQFIPRKPAVNLSIEKTVSLGQKTSASLLLVGDESLLLGVTPGSVALLRAWRRNAEASLEVRGQVR